MTCNSSIPTDLDSRDPDSSDSSLQPFQKRQLGLMNSLHPDIVLAIFSYLSQEDCLASMAVCRDWYYTIPHYTQKAWKTLTLSARDARSENQRKIRCLGDHVKCVVLDTFENESDVYYIMRKLLDWGCTNLKTLEFIRSATDDQDAFLDVLTKLAPNVTRLKMLDHQSNIAFLHVFRACPELTHFIYEVRARAWCAHEVYDQEPVVHNAEELSPLTLTTKITHLYLDPIMETSVRTYPVLRSCPELRCYVGPSKRATVALELPDEESGYQAISVDFDHLFNWCPKINHVQSFFTHYSADEIGDIDLYTNNPNCTGIRRLDVSEDCGGERIAAWLLKNQDTLEYLSLQSKVYSSEIQFNWNSAFQSLQPARLHTLELEIAHFDTTSLVSLLNNCLTLEVLKLNCKKQTFDPSTLQSLCMLHRLRSVSCDSLCIDDVCLKTLLDRFPVLEELVLAMSCIVLTVPRYMGYATNQLKYLRFWSVDWRTNHDSDTRSEEEAIAQFFYYWTGRSKLETIILAFVQAIGNKALLSIANIPTLKDFNVSLGSTRINEGGLLQFATKLHGTAIEKLELSDISQMSSAILNTFGELLLLRELQLSQLKDEQDIWNVKNILGLLHMLQKSRSLMVVSLSLAWLDGSSRHDRLSASISQEAPQYYVEEKKKPFPFEPYAVRIIRRT